MVETIRMGSVELRFLQSKQETGDSLDLFEMTLQPGGRMPIPHYHEDWDETIYGLSGTTSWRVAGEDIQLVPGQTIFIRRGVVHGFSNTSGEPSTSLCVLTPGRLGPAYFREMAALLAAGTPDPGAMKQVMAQYGLVPVPPAA